MKRFIVKKINTKNLQKRRQYIANADNAHVIEKNENNDVLNDNDTMETKEKIKLANEILDTQSKVKKIKKEKGIIERTESSKKILTEDNRELLRG